MAKLDELLVFSDSSIGEAMSCIDRNTLGIALIVEQGHRLIGTVTDGDIRRAILAGLDLKLPLASLLQRPTLRPYPQPITAPMGTPHAEILRLMNEHSIRHIPLVDDKDRVVDVALLGDMMKEYDLPLVAVVMAGGFGNRLRPFTENIPKPMLPVGDRPLLERTIERLRQAGIRRVNLSTHYKADVIAEHFGDGSNFGVQIRYLREDQPRGTAGALSLLEWSDDPLLVINGDILTRVDFRAMLDFHREQRAEMTVAVRQYEFHVPYGVVHTNGPTILGVSEKPTVRFFINAGIYLLNPGVCRHIPDGTSFDMTDLISRLIADGPHVISFPIREYWLDIGQVEDYQKALEDVKNGDV